MTVTIEKNPRAVLLDFLARYALEHPDHPTPSFDLMSREVGVDINRAHLLLFSLENDGLIHIVSHKPLRVMLRNNGGVINPSASSDREERFLSADAQRHSLGRFIGDHEALNGRGPTLREMATHLNVSNHSWVWNAAMMLAKKGVITFGEGVPTKLTEQGRRLYGFKPEPQPEAKVVIIERKETKMTMPRKFAPRKAHADRMDDIGKFILAYQEKNDGRPPLLREIAKGIGLAEQSGSVVGTVLDAMAERGLILPRGFKTKGTFKFTPEGLARFNPPEGGPPLANEIRYVDSGASPQWEIQEAEARRAAIAPEPITFPSPPQPITIADVTAADLVTAQTADLILELIDRGYIVKRGG